ncbi:hypothetical protein GCM10010218_49260 [Streptomyces mashuensis]|uniref:Uncharacterized protein n=1 Tax=Streptomyces mashuensis TaxID=33904 RepID=A0A919EF22_9ACTN|nr:hypothetical protein [Streptomyces mashuensis]GHF61825.1 hypothetical protein GCM10010218_49260 [Streptomyces mashuensis]
MRLLAYMVRPGDVVVDKGKRETVKDVRTKSYSNGRREALISLKSGRTIRLDGDDPIRVERGRGGGR